MKNILDDDSDLFFITNSLSLPLLSDTDFPEFIDSEKTIHGITCT